MQISILVIDDSAIVYRIFDFHMFGALLYSMTMPDNDLLNDLLPQPASA